LAHELRARGIGPGDVVAVFCEPSVDWAVAMLGTLVAGAAYLPVDARYPASRVAAMIADAGASAVLTQSSLGYTGEVPGLALDDPAFRGALAGHPDTDPDVALPPGALAYLLFTSGSTGRPKAVAVTHDGVVAYLDGVSERADLQPGWSYAQVSTLAADLGNTNVFGALTGGGRLHLLSYEQATDPDVLSAYFAAHRIDAMKLVPSHFAVLLGATEAAAVVPHRLLVLAGETCRPELVARARELRPDVLVHNHYGPTETTVSVLGTEVAQPAPASIPLGRPIGASVCHVLDAGLQPVPDGLPGELYVGGPGVARGYHARPGLTADRFGPDPFGAPGGRLYRTGDRVRRRADGVIEFLGRVDAQVKIRGYRVEPGEVEAALGAQPEIAHTAVRAWGQGSDVRLAGYLVLHDGYDDTAVVAIRERLRAALPDHLVPSSFTVLEELPRNANGKLDRAALPEPSAAAAVASEYAAPSTELQAEIAAVFAEVLGVERVGLDDNFFDLGGESFSAVRVARRISRPVRVIEVFTRPTVRGLAEHLDTPADTDERLLHRLTPPGRHAEIALVCVPYGGGSAITYQPLADALDADSALWALQLPGHDPSRPDEAPVGLRDVARRCAAEVQERVAGDIVVYGHCLGGAMAVEIARLLEESGRTVRGVVLAGTFPSARLPGRVFGTINRLFPADRWTSTRAYREFLRSLGGVDDDAPQAEQEQLIAALRHDLREAEEYYTEAFAAPDGDRAGDTPATGPTLSAPILCVVGERDRATELYEERAAEWAHFSPHVDLAVMPRAGHYFLKHQAA
ncbi:MAG: amino acid adenylation domain-containing protein, partial [Geodermatophilaceae bacterium]|nr:amino acid adenylation domain-containing protein [Geodermatophilaceae bacterium]